MLKIKQSRYGKGNEEAPMSVDIPVKKPAQHLGEENIQLGTHQKYLIVTDLGNFGVYPA